MYITPNRLLPPTSRVIKPFNCSFISVEGPNIIGKLNMSGVEIPYESQFNTRMVLNPGATNQPLLYGFLGSEVTFILLKFTYNETDPLCNIEENQFVTYYFEDQPSIKRYANKLLLLTGNSTHRIPQMFLENPGTVKVIVEALVANLEQSDVTLDNIRVLTINNLYHNSVLSDTIWVQSESVSGSTQLQVVGVDDLIELFLDYTDILTIETQESTHDLIISSASDTRIVLNFLSLFEMYQARSRISWVTKSPTLRYLTADSPGVDLDPPVFGLSELTPVDVNTYVYPFEGFTVLPSDVLYFFVTGITDARDGVISVDSAEIIMREIGHIEPISSITHIGVYDIIIKSIDNANNQSMLNYTLIADNVSPVITFKPVASGSTFTMTVADMGLPSTGITISDIIYKSIDSIYDSIDGTILNSEVSIVIEEIAPDDVITVTGDYTLTYSVSDRAANEVTYTKTLTYE